MPGYGRNKWAYQKQAKQVAKGPICWLCGNPIDPNLKWPDLYSGSADHVESLAAGGALLGEMRPAHLIGNLRRQQGARDGEDVDWCAPPAPRKASRLMPRHSQDW